MNIIMNRCKENRVQFISLINEELYVTILTITDRLLVHVS